MLHIVNKSPTDAPALASCLRLARPGDALLLIEDGVYAATRGAAASTGIEAALARLQVHVLAPDVDARGMTGRIVTGVTAVDYGGFVDLVAAHPNNQSWL